MASDIIAIPRFGLPENAQEEILSPPSCTALLAEFERKRESERKKWKKSPGLHIGKTWSFELTGENAGKDVYNSSAPFEMEDKTYVCGRVEHPHTCIGSQVRFFERGADGVWRVAEDSPVFHMEDGFCTEIGREKIIGGVKASPPQPYYTVFYRKNVSGSMEEFTRGPDGMKGIRLLSADGRILFFTRPQRKQPCGRDCGPGMIAYGELESIDHLNAENLLKTRIIENQFAPGEWGGPNQPILLPDGRIGIVGHIAYRDPEGFRHYYAMAFIYNPKTHEATPLEIIAKRDDFPPGEAKAWDLQDVIYPGGIVRHHNGTATLYTGLSDKHVGCIIIPDPFGGKI